MKFITKVVCAATQVSKMTSRYDATHVLSLMDPGSKVFLHPKRKVEWKRFIFEDNLKESELYSPTKEHIQQLLNWAKTLPETANLLVHCYAGISRSTACAIAVECVRNNVQTYDEIQKVFQYMRSIRPMMMPNPLIIKFTDELMGLNGELISYLNHYMKMFDEEHKNVPLILLRGNE